MKITDADQDTLATVFGDEVMARTCGAGARIEHNSPRIEFQIEVAA